MSEVDANSHEEGAPKAPTVYDILMVMADQLAAVAWQKLGLQPDPFTGKVEMNLTEAKVAIDVTTHLSTFVHPHLEEADQRQLHNLIRDLRINYVEKSKGGTT